MYGIRNVNLYKKDSNKKISELSAYSFVPNFKLNSSKNITTDIIGRFQRLKSLYHQNLCQYINVTKNRKGSYKIIIYIFFFISKIFKNINTKLKKYIIHIIYVLIDK